MYYFEGLIPSPNWNRTKHSFKHIEIRGPIMAIWSLFNMLVLELWRRISRGLGFEPIGVCFRYDDLEFFPAWLEIRYKCRGLSKLSKWTLHFFCLGRSGRFWQYWNCRAKAKICYFWGGFFSTFHGQILPTLAFKRFIKFGHYFRKLKLSKNVRWFFLYKVGRTQNCICCWYVLLTEIILFQSHKKLIWRCP